MNLIDLVAICPFYISLILEGLEDFAIIGKTGKIIRLVRTLSLMRKLQCFLEQGNAPQKQRRDTLIMKTIKPLPPRFGWCAFWGFSSWFDILQVFHHSCCIKTGQRGSFGKLKPFLCNIDHLHNCLHSQGFNPCSTPCSKLIRCQELGQQNLHSNPASNLKWMFRRC